MGGGIAGTHHAAPPTGRCDRDDGRLRYMFVFSTVTYRTCRPSCTGSAAHGPTRRPGGRRLARRSSSPSARWRPSLGGQLQDDLTIPGTESQEGLDVLEHPLPRGRRRLRPDRVPRPRGRQVTAYRERDRGPRSARSGRSSTSSSSPTRSRRRTRARDLRGRPPRAGPRSSSTSRSSSCEEPRIDGRWSEASAALPDGRRSTSTSAGQMFTTRPSMPVSFDRGPSGSAWRCSSSS